MIMMSSIFVFYQMHLSGSTFDFKAENEGKEKKQKKQKRERGEEKRGEGKEAEKAKFVTCCFQKGKKDTNHHFCVSDCDLHFWLFKAIYQSHFE